MEAKFWAIVLFIILFIILVGFIAVALAGCASTGRVDPAVLEYQRQIDELEGRIRSYEAATEYTIRELETVSGRASKMGATVDELIELFDEYQRAVERILYNYRAAESETSRKVKGSISVGDCPRS